MLKYWKLSQNDLKSVSNWDRYTFFKDIMFNKTSYKKSSWIIINSNNKMTARLNALRYLLETIKYEGKKDLKPKKWTLSKQNKIQLDDVIFDKLTDEQYLLLNRIKQTY